MSNLNKIYHKGKFRSGEWAKHLRPYLKRVGNKRWRKAGKNNDADNEIIVIKRKLIKRAIKVRITSKYYGDRKVTSISKYRTLRDAKNAMKRANVFHAEILTEEK